MRRKNLERVVTVSSDVIAGVNSNAVLGEVQRTLDRFEAELPPGYSMRYTGEQEEQQEATEFLGSAFLIALLLIGFILISQFNSVVKPVIILTSVIMSLVDDFEAFFARHYRRRPAESEAAAPVEGTAPEREREAVVARKRLRPAEG